MNAVPATAALLLVAATAAAQDRICTVHTIHGRELRGPVTVDEGFARIGGQDSVSIPLDEILEIDQSAFVDLRRPRETHRVWLRSGDSLAIEKVSGPDPGAEGPPFVRLGMVSARSPLEIPMRHVAAIRMERGDGMTAASFDADRAEPHATRDYLYVVHEGRVMRYSVNVRRFEDTSVHFTLGEREIEFGLDRVVAVVFGVNTGVAPDPQPKPRATVTMRTGGKVAGRLLALGDTLTLVMDEGPRVELPRNVVVGIDFATDKMVYLSDLTPEVEQTPALDRVWPVYVDRSPGGPGIYLGGKGFQRGLVIVPRTRLTYDLGDGYDRFEALIGIEDRAGPQAHAVFRVLVDGESIYESEPMTRGSKPEALSLPIASAKTLTLEADFGMNLDLGDHCVFLEARVVRN